MRRLLGLLGLLAIVGSVASMLVAYREKLRRGEQPPFDEMADEIDRAVIFDNIDAVSRAQAFRGGNLDLWYGGGKLDLRGATLDPAGADLRIRAIFGGLELDVPSSWAVDVRGRAIAGGVGGARGAGPVDESGPRLVLHVLAVFGGVAIVSRSGDELMDATEVVAIPIQAESTAVSPS
jgi:hypothetical protein